MSEDCGTWTLLPGTAPATSLAFSSSPTTGIVAVALSPLVVQLRDAGNNVVSGNNSTQVTISKSSGPGTLSCPPRIVTSGVATFTNCTVDTPGTYVLQATSSPALTPASTGSITISGPPSPPLPPTYDRIVALSTNSLQLHWGDNADNEDFYLAYRIGPGPSVQVGGSLPPTAARSPSPASRRTRNTSIRSTPGTQPAPSTRAPTCPAGR